MANSVLPYWDQNIDLDIAPWVPYGKDYSPVTVNSLCNPTLGTSTSRRGFLTARITLRSRSTLSAIRRSAASPGSRSR